MQGQISLQQIFMSWWHLPEQGTNPPVKGHVTSDSFISSSCNFTLTHVAWCADIQFSCFRWKEHVNSLVRSHDVIIHLSFSHPSKCPIYVLYKLHYRAELALSACVSVCTSPCIVCVCACICGCVSGSLVSILTWFQISGKLVPAPLTHFFPCDGGKWASCICNQEPP